MNNIIWIIILAVAIVLSATIGNLVARRTRKKQQLQPLFGVVLPKENKNNDA
jgi:uncharacterized protein YneF (UPF0154 family)